MNLTRFCAGSVVATQIGYAIASRCFPEMNAAGRLIDPRFVLGARVFLTCCITPAILQVPYEKNFFSVDQKQSPMVEAALGIAAIAVTHFTIAIIVPEVVALIAVVLPTSEFFWISAFVLAYMAYFVRDRVQLTHT